VSLSPDYDVGREPTAPLVFLCGRQLAAWDIPLWAPTVISAALLLISPFTRKQRKPGSCGHCGYDLTGNVSGVCPECGTRVPPGRSAPSARFDTAATERAAAGTEQPKGE
jgi:hypothetical protein